MPHLIANRPRILNLTKGENDLPAQLRWETINAILYKIGGLSFVIGSIFFFPALDRFSDTGAWIFFGGSILYLIVTAHDLAEVRHYWHSRPSHSDNDRLELVAAFSYQWGTILFLIGSIFFLSSIDRIYAGAWCFIIGSLLFVLGASINVLQVPQKTSRGSLQLVNLTAVSFVTGSVLFTVASVPYLWKAPTEASSQVLHAFLAAQYLMGSFLFLFGGVTNYVRAYGLIRKRIREGSA